MTIEKGMIQPEPCDGGFLVLESDMPELIRQAEGVVNHLLGLYAFRLSCELKEDRSNKGE